MEHQSAQVAQEGMVTIPSRADQRPDQANQAHSTWTGPPRGIPAVVMNVVLMILPESSTIPSEGIDFDLPDELRRRVSKAFLGCCRRLHINSGHPPNADLERVLRLAGGSDDARAVIRYLRCTVCARLQKSSCRGLVGLGTASASSTIRR